MGNTVLSISGLTKYLGSRLILNGISVEVNAGEIFGFIGPNGSGKTTTIKVMLGLLHLDTGKISICGHDIKTHRSEAMSCVGGIIENPEMYKYLTARQNLEQYRRMQPEIPKKRIDEVVELVGLTQRIDDKVGKYSLGMKQRLGLAQALLNRPRLLVLDEPTNGLDPAGIKELRDILKKVSHEEGTAVFISSHQLAELDLMCDRIAVIDKGSIIAVRSMDEVRRLGRCNIEEFTIETIEPAVKALCTALERLGYKYTISGESVNVIAEASSNDSSRHVVADTVREAVMMGVPVLSVVPVRHSLEDAFLALTGGGVVIPAADNGNEFMSREKETKESVATSKIGFADPRSDSENVGGESK